MSSSRVFVRSLRAARAVAHTRAAVRPARSFASRAAAALTTAAAPHARYAAGAAAHVALRTLHTSGVAAGRIPFKLADIGEGIKEVEVLQWFVKEGDVVEQFDNIVEVQSDKATTEISSRYAGTVVKVHYEVGDLAQVGDPLVDIEVAGTSVKDEAAPAEKEAPAAAAAAPADAPADVPAPVAAAGKALATPAVRRIAREHGLDISVVEGTGKGGRVLKGDVLAYLERGSAPAPAAAPAAGAPPTPVAVEIPAGAPPVVLARRAEDHVEPVRGIKRTMVKTMTESLTIPHFGFSDDVLMNKLVEMRAAFKPLGEKYGAKVTYMPFIMKAMSLALAEYPILNACVNDACTEVHYRGAHNISIAMDTPAGLLVPVVKDVQDRNVIEIAQELGRLQALGRAGKLAMDDMTGGTVSLSNVGVIGGTYASPVLTKGNEVLIGALGKIDKVPRFDAAGNVYAAHVMGLSWSADHRVIDGATCARFSNVMKEYLEAPETMLMHLR